MILTFLRNVKRSFFSQLTYTHYLCGFYTQVVPIALRRFETSVPKSRFIKGGNVLTNSNVVLNTPNTIVGAL